VTCQKISGAKHLLGYIQDAINEGLHVTEAIGLRGFYGYDSAGPTSSMGLQLHDAGRTLKVCFRERDYFVSKLFARFNNFPIELWSAATNQVPICCAPPRKYRIS